MEPLSLEMQTLADKLLSRIEKSPSTSPICTFCGFFYRKSVSDPLYLVTLSHNLNEYTETDKNWVLHNRHFKKMFSLKQLHFFQDEVSDLAVAPFEPVITEAQIIERKKNCMSITAGDIAAIYCPYTDPFVYSEGVCMGYNEAEYKINLKLCDGMSGGLVIKKNSDKCIGIAVATGASDIDNFERHFAGWTSEKQKKEKKNYLEKIFECLLLNETYTKVLSFQLLDEIICKAEDFFNEYAKWETKKNVNFHELQSYFKSIEGSHSFKDVRFVGNLKDY